MDDRFEFSSVLPAEYAEDLGALLFFNLQKTAAPEGILRSIAEYGAPALCIDGDTVSVKVGALDDVQTIFALDGTGEGHELAGLVLYVRTDIENVLVLHIAVAERFSAAGADADAMLVMRLINTVPTAGRRLRGVRL